MLSKGFKVRFGVDPAASATIIVSPIALEIAKKNDAIIPDEAAGKTIFFIVSNLFAPNAKDASLKDLGTAEIASSLIDVIRGVTIIPRAIDAERALNIFVWGKIFIKNGVNKVKAIYPYTTDGIPAKTSSIGFIIFLVFLDAYSLR